MRLVIGIGNPWRRDDGAGLAVARRLDGVEHRGDGAALLDAWAGAQDVAVIDAAAAADMAPGTVWHADPHAGALTAGIWRSSSTHGFGVPEALELARALGYLPARIDVYAIVGADFAPGYGLTPAVEDAVEALATALTT